MESPDTVTLHIGPARMTVEVSPDGECAAAREVIRDLEEDFRLFGEDLLPTCRQTSFHMVLCCGHTPEPTRGLRILKFRDATCFGLGPRRTVRYDDGCSVEANHRTGFARIWASTKARLYEIAYLFTLSKVGEILDTRGLHRVHALGVLFSEIGRTGLFLMDAGGGKTTLALSLSHFLPSGTLEFFSDELPLTDGRLMFPFPMRVAMSEQTLKMFPRDSTPEFPIRTFRRQAFGQKFLMPLEALGVIARARVVDEIFICSRSGNSEKPSFRRAGRLRILRELVRSCVVGVGVPQMTEHFLRFDVPHLFRLATIAVSRLGKAVRLAITCDGYLVELTEQPEKNARAVHSHFHGC